MGLSPAASSQAFTPPAGVYVACGYDNGTTAPANTAGTKCMTLPDAITAALANHPGGVGSTQKIYLMPGHYCPIALWASPLGNLDYNGLDLIGAGNAGLAKATDDVKEQASLVSFEYNSTFCGSTIPGAMVSGDPGAQGSQSLGFEDLTFDGTDGPSTGLSITDIGTSLRDVVVQSFSGTGITFNNQRDQGFEGGAVGFDAENSAIIDNGNGASLTGSYLGIDDSTIAGNTTYGVEQLSQSGSLNLLEDTITHNAYGLYNATTGVQAINTVLAGNSNSDCQGSNLPSGFDESNDLLGGSCTITTTSGDVAYEAADPIGTPADNGGPTPSILPSNQAVGAGEQECETQDHTDQREAYMSAADSCDIGSVETAGSLKPDVSTTNASVYFPPTDPKGTGAQESLLNTGGDRVGVRSVKVTGDKAFSLGTDSCTYTPLESTFDSDGCSVEVTYDPPAAHRAYYGDLVISTTQSGATGTIKIPLSGGIDSTSLTTVSPRSVIYGHKAKIVGVLIDTSTHQPLPHATVSLYEATGSGALKSVGQTTTNSAGRAILSEPLVSAARFRWHDSEQGLHTSALSTVRTVAVRQGVTASLVDSSVRHGHRATVIGTVSPPAPRRSVQLEVEQHGHWAVVNTAKIKRTKSKALEYAASFKPAKPGHVKLRVVIAKTHAFAAGASPTLTLQVS